MVNMNPQVITNSQLKELYTILSSDVRLTGNNRNIQDRNDRAIYRFSNVGTGSIEMSQASTITVASALAVICLLSI